MFPCAVNFLYVKFAEVSSILLALKDKVHIGSVNFIKKN